MKRSLSMLMACLMLIPAAAGAGSPFAPNADRALDALEQALTLPCRSVYVYHDFGDTLNHFTQRAIMGADDLSLVGAPDENCRENPAGGDTCIRLKQISRERNWGGWLFLNGRMAKGKAPQLNKGDAPGQGMDLTGARELVFLARGEKGGETVHFFTLGYGLVEETPVVPFPDSAPQRSLGDVTLEREWTEYRIGLEDADLSCIACGFGFVMSGDDNDEGETVFYLDEIRFEGDFSGLCHPMLRSYVTDDPVLHSTAYTYDNALAAMAFLSAGRRAGAEMILDSFVYAVENDRDWPGQIRNAYAAGDITAFPGWQSGARLPGWAEAGTGAWHEDPVQTGLGTGNTCYAALALLQYDAVYGSEKYLNTAALMMDWVLENCRDDHPGFTAGFDAWGKNGESPSRLTYKSTEHNIDALAAFRRLFDRTGDGKYLEAAESAMAFIRSMYSPERGLFFTGTLSDGATPNTENVVLDAQVWTYMALGKEFGPYEAALETAAAMRTPEGAYPFSMAGKSGSWWPEGTAFTALAHRLKGEDGMAEETLQALAAVQREDGLFPAAVGGQVSTGFGLFDGTNWEYSDSPHIAPTAWFVMAVNGFNPYAFPGGESVR
ncbi:MAG: hypothetical protein IKI84_13875 [Clostridia bacterium]|nr:hypothetical protein [Clostridia bacterium]